MLSQLERLMTDEVVVGRATVCAINTAEFRLSAVHTGKDGARPALFHISSYLCCSMYCLCVNVYCNTATG